MINKTEIRDIIGRLQHNGLHDLADHIWDLLDAYHQLHTELTLKILDFPTTQQATQLITSAYQHSEIAGQEILGCLSHYFDNDTNRLVRCQTPNGHHDMHTHRRTSDTAVHLYIWDDDEAFNVTKTPTEPTT